MNSLSSKPELQIDCILVVDDLSDNSFLLQTVLENEGYQVEVANSGQAALDKIAEHPPELVLLDVMMPEMNGFEVTRKIRENTHLQFIPILLVTGYSGFMPAEGFDAGADGFIRKPIDFDNLLHQVKAILQPSHLINPSI
ncbi:response regulator [Phormidium sp. CLA17]|uniref:response regulator n=1 Tax=Leptolyngbya sp. Cla-17 TaxID=2803751 RepID=UPI0014925A81|nr:response regulator [Leptolyngbya sp. Cla-17]MBM0743981.1 response regulator [Leptolyngbya sp. Cla-17]